jgi:hypothetical protein
MFCLHQEQDRPYPLPKRFNVNLYILQIKTRGFFIVGGYGIVASFKEIFEKPLPRIFWSFSKDRRIRQWPSVIVS